MGVARFGDAPSRDVLAARVLGGGEAYPGGEGRCAAEPREHVRLDDDGEGRHGLYALDQAERVDSFPPSVFPGMGSYELLYLLLVGLEMPDLRDVVGEGLLVGLFPELDLSDPGPISLRPVPLPLSFFVDLVEYVAVPEQELGEPLLRANQVVARIFQRTGEVPHGLALLIGHHHLDDVVGAQHASPENGVVAIVLPSFVGCGLLHLGYCADDAVDAKGPQLPDEVKTRDARLVNRLGLFEGKDPIGDLGRRGPELLGDDLACDRVERGAGDGAGVYVEAD